MKHFKHTLEGVFFIAGMVLFGLVIQSVEPSRLSVLSSALSAKGWLVFAFYPFMCSWDVMGWKSVFAEVHRSKIRFRDLFTIRLAGEAVNNVTPIVDVGGEPLKVVLASKRFGIPKKSCLDSVIIGKTAIFLAEIFFVAAGVVLSFFLLPMPGQWRWGLVAGVCVFGLLVMFFIFAQKRGLFETFIQWLDVFEFDPRLFERFHIPFQQIDDEIVSFYSSEKGRFRTAVLFHTAGWFAGSVETYFMFHLLGVPVSLIQAVMLESLLQLIRTASFFIPANLGTQEAGLAFLVQALGYHPALGVAASLLKRIRQVLWTGAGFAVWGAYQLIYLKANAGNKERGFPNDSGF